MTTVVNFLDRSIIILKKPVYFISNSLFYISTLLIGLMSLPIVCDVFFRIFFNKSVMGVIEIEEFILVIVVFGGIATTQIEKAHITIDILVQKFSKKTQDTIDIFNYALGFGLFIILAWQLLVQANKKIGLVSQSLSIPISIFIALAAFCTLILALVILIDLLGFISQMLKENNGFSVVIALVLAFVLFMLPYLLEIMSLRITGLALGTLGFSFLFILLLFKMPIAFGMTLVGLLGMFVVSSNPKAALNMMGIAPYSATASFILVVVPLFILMGELAFRSGISQDLFETAYKWFGRLPGGLAMASVAGCAGFAAVCGDSIATAVTMGTVSLPEMRRKKYDVALATGSLAAGGTLGILIPPSVGFIFYAIVAEESIGKLFVAGLVPGIMLASLFMLYIYVVTKRNPQLGPPGEKTSWREKFISLKGVIGMLFLIVLILGGILAGFFSPTEGGAIGAFGAFIIAIAKRQLTYKNLKASLEVTVRVTCMLIFILVGVAILGYFLAATRLPFELAAFVTGLNVGRYIILLAVVILYIILGCIMNVIPIILLTLPAILPTVLTLGFDPIWFGVVTVILMQMGQITPPIGINLFAINSVAKDVPLQTIAKGVLPFFICMLIAVVLLVIFPQIALFLPNILFS